jgi:NAD(P)H-dependent FMN reductase
MGNRILVFYGSYRSDRTGIRLAQFVVERLSQRGDDVELIDAKAIDLPRETLNHRKMSRPHSAG